MSISIGTYTTAHLESATGPHGQPLPLRERTYGACSGHCGCAIDWAALTEMFAERFFTDSPPDRSIDVYHHQTVDSAIGEWAFGGYVEYSIGTAQNSFLDPSWTPQDMDGSGWDFYTNQDNDPPVGRVSHGFHRTSSPLVLNNDLYRQDTHRTPGAHLGATSPTPRSLDEMRRLFYDAKTMFRINTQCAVSYSLSNIITYERRQGGGEYGNDPGTITLGSDVLRVAQRVRNTSGYRVRNNGAAWAMVEMWCAKDAPQIFRPENHKRTIVVPCSLGGTLDSGRFNPQALKSWLQSVFGSFAEGHDYYAQARIAAVYADIDFPADYFFTGWNWTPQGD